MKLVLLMMSAMVLQGDDKSKERENRLRPVFEAMEKGIRKGEEKPFKEQWHPDGYAKNLVGGSGIPGGDVFKQGVRKKWFPKPDYSKVQALGDGAAFIVPCSIWSWEKEKGVDQVDLLVVKTEATVEGKATTVFVVLGGGEKREQVEALANRWLRKEPLDPPKDEGDRK